MVFLMYLNFRMLTQSLLLYTVDGSADLVLMINGTARAWFSTGGLIQLTGDLNVSGMVSLGTPLRLAFQAGANTTGSNMLSINPSDSFSDGVSIGYGFHDSFP